MGVGALFLATLLYLVVAIDFLLRKQYGHVLVWTGYVIANIGMIMIAIEATKAKP